MSLADIEKIVSSQFVWAILCLIVVAALYKILMRHMGELKTDNAAREQEIKELYKEHKTEAAQREQKLIDHLERTTDTLEGIEKNLNKLGEEMETGFKDIWDHVGSNNPSAPSWDGRERRRR